MLKKRLYKGSLLCDLAKRVIDEEKLEELKLVYLSNKEPSDYLHFKDRVSNTG